MDYVQLITPISIHAPREGGDVKAFVTDNYSYLISIHAPREGGDITIGTAIASIWIFQSTPPARGATWRRRSGRRS